MRSAAEVGLEDHGLGTALRHAGGGEVGDAVQCGVAVRRRPHAGPRTVETQCPRCQRRRYRVACGSDADLDRRRPSGHGGGQGSPPEPRRRAFHREDSAAGHRQPLPPTSIQPAQAGHLTGTTDGHLDQPERLRPGQLGGQVRGDGARPAVEGVVAAPRRRGVQVGEDPRQGGCHDVRRRGRRQVHPHGAGRSRRDRLPQHVLGGRWARRHGCHRLAPRIPTAQGELQCRRVRRRQARGAGIGDDLAGRRIPLGPPVHPLQAGGDHDRRKTTPNPPSGYVQVMAPSVSQAR